MSSKRSDILELFKQGDSVKSFVVNTVRQIVSDEICRFKELAKMANVQEVVENVQRAASQHWERFLFNDEKLFTIQQILNSQNDRIWSGDNSSTSTVVGRHQYRKSVMVWCGIIASGKTPLSFMVEGVKINHKVYRRDIIEAVVLPWAQKHFGNAN
ncbi:uncharacterized protein TNCV_4110991 [Trichonephila clavipes]|nr:uncharacterized protein TNCV_4110991 [Trichonephila clavipes]